MNILNELLKKLGLKKGHTKGTSLSSEEVLAAVFQSDLQNLQETREQLDKHAFAMAVEMVLSAKTIYVLGVRSCESLAGFLGFYLNMMFEQVKVIQTNSPSEILEQILRIGKEDVLIGISFPRYSMHTLKAMEYANNQNAKVIAITDSTHSPMNLYSSCNLIAKSELASVLDSLTAPYCVINALIVALCLKRETQMTNYLTALDQIWDEYQTYSSEELNQADHHIELWQAHKENTHE